MLHRAPVLTEQVNMKTNVWRGGSSLGHVLSASFVLVIVLCAVDRAGADVPTPGTRAYRRRNVAELREELESLRHTVANLAKQTMSQQLFVEERIRSSGTSGIKVTRTHHAGNSNYHRTSHISSAIAAIHDHPNLKRGVGMGETVVVLNGVEFRTRHNDYKIKMASPTNKTYGVVEDVPLPDVPPEVLAKSTVEGQIDEMSEWFTAFQKQDHSVRDYRKYFKPVLCYLEGAWTLDKELNEPFESDRHQLVATTWDELQQQIRYTSFSGTKDLKENFSWLPTTIMSVDKVTGKPQYAQWNYRILCHPIPFDVPTKYFRQQDDLAFRTATQRTMEKIAEGRAARYVLSEFNEDRWTGPNTFLDLIMKQIPGKDNSPDMLQEAPFNIPILDTRFANDTLLNTGYYHRSFRTNKKGAMGLMNIYRGFNDDYLFVAETTQPNIAKESYKWCRNNKGRGCVTRSTGFSYAIPLEVIYLTPLANWNPYDIAVYDDKDIVLRGGRKGSMTRDKAYNGTTENGFFYRTPTKFFTNKHGEERDPADTDKFGVGVLDRQGNVRSTTGSGTKVITLPIKGAGRVRLRYPIPPIHGESSSVWREVSVIKKKLNEVEAASDAGNYLMGLFATSFSGLHKHEFYLTVSQWDKINEEGATVNVTTSVNNGHNHELEVWLNPEKNRMEYKTCDGRSVCWDRHNRKLDIKERPTHG